MTLQEKLRRLIAKWRDEAAFERDGHMMLRCVEDLEKALAEDAAQPPPDPIAEDRAEWDAKPRW